VVGIGGAPVDIVDGGGPVGSGGPGGDPAVDGTEELGPVTSMAGGGGEVDGGATPVDSGDDAEVVAVIEGAVGYKLVLPKGEVLKAGAA